MRVGDATTDSPFRSERVNSPGTQGQHCLGSPPRPEGPKASHWRQRRLRGYGVAGQPITAMALL
jgi:hypothetical protein